VFLTKSHLKQHTHSHSSARPYVCTICKKTYRTKGYLDVHLITHTNQIFPCSICNKEYSGPTYLREHIRNKHQSRDKKFKCEFCEAQFLSGYKLNRHMQSHLGEKDLPSSSNFPEENSVTKSKDFKVKRKIFRIGERPFKCKICSRRFHSMADWGLHVRTHPEFQKRREWGECKNQTNFKCVHCTKSFYASKGLIQHLSTHRPEIEFNCRPCFVLLQNLDNT